MTHRNGFTIIETLLYISIVGIMFIGISTFLVTMLSARVKNQSINEVDEQGAFAMTVISQALRNAKSVQIPTVGNTAVELKLLTDDPQKNPTTFNVVNGTLYRTEGNSQPSALTNSFIELQSPLFSNVSSPQAPDLVQVELFLRRQNVSDHVEYEYEKKFITTAGVYVL